MRRTVAVNTALAIAAAPDDDELRREPLTAIGGGHGAGSTYEARQAGHVRGHRDQSGRGWRNTRPVPVVSLKVFKQVP